MKVRDLLTVSAHEWDMDVEQFVKQSHPNAGLVEKHPDNKIQSVPAKGYGYMMWDVTDKKSQFFFVNMKEEEIGYARMALKMIKDGSHI